MQISWESRFKFLVNDYRFELKSLELWEALKLSLKLFTIKAIASSSSFDNFWVIGKFTGSLLLFWAMAWSSLISFVGICSYCLRRSITIWNLWMKKDLMKIVSWLLESRVTTVRELGVLKEQIYLGEPLKKIFFLKFVDPDFNCF